MLKYCLAAALATAGITSPVFAQDAEPAADKAAAGFRVEAMTGYEDASFDSIRDGSGLLYGVGVGYDLAAGRFRFGVEAEASDSTAKDCSVFAGNNICSRSGRDLYAGARVGGMISDNVLLYGKVGYTSFRNTNRLTPVAGGTTIVLHPEFDGLRLGAGTEIAVGAKTFIKAEYRFSNYEAADGFDRHQGVIGFGLRF
jgi:outer membrane immunogenic protein